MTRAENSTIVRNDGCTIVAEVSANHNGSFETAVDLIKAARDCRADAVKFQAYTPDTLTINVDNDHFRIQHPKWGGQTLYELYEKAQTPWEWLGDLKGVCDEVGIMFLCSAFDRTSVDLLESIGICAHKISSFELVDIPLIEYAASTGKPLILSTGMADVCEIRDAVDAARTAGAGEITLLKCTSSYPATPKEMNLRTIPDMERLFKCSVGLSDHSRGIGAAICAVALGASVIEKHFTLSRETETPDSFFSIEPAELKDLVDNVRIAEVAAGCVHYGMTEKEKENRAFRRSLFVVKDMQAGEVFDETNVRSIRPGYGLAPKHWKHLAGRRAKSEIRRGSPLTWDLAD